jgi:hypothetical protein
MMILICRARKYKTSVGKDTPKAAPTVSSEDFNERRLEYQDHFIQEAKIEQGSVILKHSKESPSKVFNALS